MMEKKGSITAYLCLILVVMVTLILTLIDSARYSCGRAVVSAAADEGLFSVFGGYDRILYEDYGLLLVDGGYGGADLKPGALMDEISGSVDAVISSGIPGSSLFGIDIEQKAFTGCLLASDDDFLPLRRQICRFMEMKFGTDVLSGLAEKLSGTGSIIENAEVAGELDMDSISNDLKTLAEEAAASGDDSEASSEEVTVPEDFINPIDTVENIRRLGLMGFVLPPGKKVSAESADVSQFAKNRSFESGFGLTPDYSAYSLEHIMLAKYLTDMFPCFLDDDETEGLRYQTEYAVAGKDEDVKNLKSVMNRLMVVREVLNFLYLNASPVKKAEAEGVAAIIGAILTVPEGTEVITQILLLCWAYGESAFDVKTLLAGRKVPLFKDDSSWNLSLSQVAGLSPASEVSKKNLGFSYKEYLLMFLLMKPDSELTGSCASLLEYNRRIKGGDPSFSIGNCICALEAEISGRIGRHSFSLTRAYGVDISETN